MNRFAPLVSVAAMICLAMSPQASAQAWKDALKQVFGSQVEQQAGALAESEIVQGLRDALAKGTERAVLQLGQKDGFWANEQFRIPLPKTLVQGDAFLRAAGYGASLDELHLSFNRAAEQAVPVAAKVFSQAASQLSIADAQSILNGPDDAATRYFERTTGDTLAAEFKPLVAEVTAQAGLVQQYEQFLAAAGPLAAVAGVNADVNAYVTDKALGSLFTRVAQEEQAIRQNPAARSTEMMKKVFGQQP